MDRRGNTAGSIALFRRIPAAVGLGFLPITLLNLSSSSL